TFIGAVEPVGQRRAEGGPPSRPSAPAHQTANAGGERGPGPSLVPPARVFVTGISASTGRLYATAPSGGIPWNSARRRLCSSPVPCPGQGGPRGPAEPAGAGLRERTAVMPRRTLCCRCLAGVTLALALAALCASGP